MKSAKKAVRKAAVARKKAKGNKVARKARQSKIIIPSREEMQEFTSAPKGTNINLSDISAALSGAGWPPFEKMPTRLFKYAPPDWTRIWAMLADGLVYFASPKSFNDPHDCRMYPATTREEMKETIQRVNAGIEEYDKAGHDVSEFKPSEERDRHQANILADPKNASKQMAEVFLSGMNPGILCLSEKCDSLPMWAHYAKNHKGVCFVFNPYVKGVSIPEKGIGCFPLICVWPVKYRREMRKFNLESEWMRPFFEKSEEWAYEKEWRAFMMDERVESPIRKKRMPPSLGGDFSGSRHISARGNVTRRHSGMPNELRRQAGNWTHCRPQLGGLASQNESRRIWVGL